MTAVGLVDYNPCATSSHTVVNNSAECRPTSSTTPSSTQESLQWRIAVKPFWRNELTQYASGVSPPSRPSRWFNRYRMHVFIFCALLLFQACGGVWSHSYSGTQRKRYAVARHDATAVRQNGSGIQLLADYSSASVVNFAVSGDVVAVLLDNATFIAYNVSRDNSDDDLKVSEVWRRKLKAPLPLFHDFRIVNRRSILYCASQFCETCDIDKSRPDECKYFSLTSTNHTSFTNMRGWLVDDNRLILRTVFGDNTGALYSLQPSYKKPINVALDRPGINDITVVGAFATDQYTFFVGSASKIDVPHHMFTGDKSRRRRMDLRVTRVCNQDATDRLESRIDIALSCDGLGNRYWKASPKRAKAASLSEDNTRLYILLENDTTTAFNSNEETPTPSDVLCEYNVAQVIKRFEDTWDTCQGISDTNELAKSCKSGKGGSVDDERCYIFAWSRNSRVPLCQRFFAQIGDGNIDNCNLAESKKSTNRNYWIENYKPLMGRLVLRFNTSDIRPIFEGVSSDVLFASHSDAIERFQKGDLTGEPMWATPLYSTPNFAAVNPNRNALIFAEKNKLNYISLTCQNLYPTCKSISWSDPLRCRWCMNQRGEGHTFSASTPEICPNDDQALDKCPPVITQAIYDRDRFVVLGEGFTNAENIRMKACDEDCTFDREGQIAYCNAHSNCAIELSGRVGSLNHFHLVYTNHLKDPSIDNLPQAFKNNSRIIRILATIFIVFLLFVMLIAVRKLYRKHANRIRSKMHQNAEKTPMSAGAFVFGSASVIEELGGGFPVGDESTAVVGPNTIDKARIFLIKQIGHGNSSTVRLAKYVIDADANISRRVAVKTICNSTFDLEDVMREIDLISQCCHKNIVEYIGHFGDAFNRMHIVTEYMAGGDLHKFLIGPTNKLTVGDAFLFILQICEGMEYLTKKHIIHRDLAARNCMLDDANVVVKITDFGLCRTSNNDYEYISENAAQQLPFRWTAIECFGTNRKFSEKSDVWSFGVVVWEIFARDLTPYADCDSNAVREYLKGGHRLEFAHIPSCPEVIYERILLPCWETLPQNRPTFTELRGEIERNYWALKNTSPEYLRTEYETPLSSIGSPTSMLLETPSNTTAMILK